MEEFLLTLLATNNGIRTRRRHTTIHRDLIRTHAHFSIDDQYFKSIYRLNKSVAWELVESLRQFLPVQRKIIDLLAETRVLTALRFYAQGSYQLSVGRDADLLLCQKSVSNCLKLVTTAMVNNLCDRWIKFPSIEEMTTIRAKFYQKYDFPGVIGCFDGTHISIVSPPVNEHMYVNRKGYHSINVQLICDSDYRILSVNPKFPGSTHDSYVWKNSIVRRFLHERWSNGELGSSWLLGDSGYPLEPFLLTPYNEGTNVTYQQRYNRKFKVVRSIIEQVNGQLKSRFRCLLKHRVLHYSPEMAGMITIACCILHNMRKARHLQEEEEEEEEEEDNEIEVEEERNDSFEPTTAQLLSEGRRVRRIFGRTAIKKYFNKTLF